MLAHQIERVKRARTLDRVCIATTVGPADDPIVALAEAEGVEVHRGAEDDVLGRFVGAADQLNATVAVRLTGDCPLTDPELVDAAVGTFQAEQPDLDYLSNGLISTWPMGLDIEVTTTATLCTAAAEATSDYDREHVTPFIYTRPDRFRLRNIDCPTPAAEHRWTLDEQIDYALLRWIIERLRPTNPGFGWRDVLALVEANPEYAAINRHVHQRTGRST